MSPGNVQMTYLHMLASFAFAVFGCWLIIFVHLFFIQINYAVEMLTNMGIEWKNWARAHGRKFKVLYIKITLFYSYWRLKLANKLDSKTLNKLVGWFNSCVTYI